MLTTRPPKPCAGRKVLRVLSSFSFCTPKFQMPNLEWHISYPADISMALLKTWQYAQFVVSAYHRLQCNVFTPNSGVDNCWPPLGPTVIKSKFTPRSHNRDPDSEYRLMSWEQNPVQKNPHHTSMCCVFVCFVCVMNIGFVTWW
jgi:hypothetical protein